MSPIPSVILNQRQRQKKIQKNKPLHRDAKDEEWDSIKDWMHGYKDEAGRGISDDEIVRFGNTYLYEDPEYVKGWAKKRGWNPHSPSSIDYYTWNQQ